MTISIVRQFEDTITGTIPPTYSHIEFQGVSVNKESDNEIKK